MASGVTTSDGHPDENQWFDAALDLVRTAGRVSDKP
jgi:hypothetical protein